MNWFKKLFRGKAKIDPTPIGKTRNEILLDKRRKSKEDWEKKHPGENFNDRILGESKKEVEQLISGSRTQGFSACGLKVIEKILNKPFLMNEISIYEGIIIGAVGGAITGLLNWLLNLAKNEDEV